MRLLVILAMTFSFAPMQFAYGLSCPTQDEIETAKGAVDRACENAGFSGEFSECNDQIIKCKSARVRGDGCEAEELEQCGFLTGNRSPRDVARDLDDSAEKSEEKANDQKADMAGHMDKIMEALKDKSQADEDFAKEKRDIEKEQIDAERDHKAELSEIRGKIAERLKEANDKDIELSNGQLDFIDRRIEASKQVRETILGVQKVCREAKRQFEREFIQQTRELANSSDPAVRGRLRANSISEASALESRVKAERDALYEQCMADGQEAVQEARTANQELERMVQERMAQLERSKENNRQFKEQMDQADQQNVRDSMETLIRSSALRQGQIQDAETVRQNKHQNADTSIAMAEQQMQMDMANAAMGGLGGLGGGGGGGGGSSEADAAADRECADKMRSADSVIQDPDAFKRAISYFDTIQNGEECKDAKDGVNERNPSSSGTKAGNEGEDF